MKFFSNMFNISPFVIIPCAILCFIALSIKNKKAKNILFGIGGITSFVYCFTLMGIAVPYIFLSGMFENGGGIILMIAIVITVWLLVSLAIYLKNTFLVFKNSGQDIYIRDVDVKYSPAVVSYLMNNKIETKKDLPATLLNLCAKNILKIQKDSDKKIKIIDLKNKDEVQNLSEDEKYAYDMFVSGVTNKKIILWKNKVEKEYAKYKFSKQHKRNLGTYIFGIYVAIFVFVFAYMLITGESEITGAVAEVISYSIVATFIGAWEVLLVSSVKGILKSIINRNDKNEFKETYTDKGAREYTRWKKFEKFMDDFSLIKEKEKESIVIWGKYLSYSIALGINKKCDIELFKEIDRQYSFDYITFENMFDEIKE